MTADDNTLVRRTPCPECGAPMLWTQGAWTDVDSNAGLPRAAYSCLNRHVLDPATTPQCPACGIHDTTQSVDAPSFRCERCGETFQPGQRMASP